MNHISGTSLNIGSERYPLYGEQGVPFSKNGVQYSTSIVYFIGEMYRFPIVTFDVSSIDGGALNITDISLVIPLADLSVTAIYEGSLAADNAVSVKLAFSDTTPLTTLARVRITYSDKPSMIIPVHINTHNTTDEVVSISESVLFRDTSVGGRSVKSITLSNFGVVPVTITGFTVNATDSFNEFRLRSALPVTILANSVFNLEVFFTPLHNSLRKATGVLDISNVTYSCNFEGLGVSETGSLA